MCVTEDLKSEKIKYTLLAWAFDCINVFLILDKRPWIDNVKVTETRHKIYLFPNLKNTNIITIVEKGINNMIDGENKMT